MSFEVALIGQLVMRRLGILVGWRLRVNFATSCAHQKFLFFFRCTSVGRVRLSDALRGKGREAVAAPIIADVFAQPAVVHVRDPLMLQV